MNGNLNGMNNMEDIIEDLFKIYNSAIDSYNSKISQNINEKYTIIDKAMISTYLYIKILSNLNINNNISKDILINYLLKQIIYGETGNLDLEISDISKKDLYNKVLNNLINKQFEYKNRILKTLKYNYKIIENKEYNSLLEFCEYISEYYILEKLLRRGNKEVEIYVLNLENKFREYIKSEEKKSTISNEKINILDLILNKRFENSEYYNLIQVVLKLRDVYRYSTLTTIVPENVLFHQYSMTVTNIIIADYMISLGENIDKYKLVYKTLFHDFGEYKGNEIVSQIKLYNDETKKMFEQIEENDERELKELIGEDIYTIITDYKKEKEGYIADIIDKIQGIMKLWIEVGYMNNYTYLKALCSLYQKRFEKFKNLERLEGIKNKEFLLQLLKESYLYIKEKILYKDYNILIQYFTKKEIEDFEKEIKELKN